MVLCKHPTPNSYIKLILPFWLQLSRSTQPYLNSFIQAFLLDNINQSFARLNSNDVSKPSVNKKFSHSACAKANLVYLERGAAIFVREMGFK